MYDFKGRVAECTGAHIFFIRGTEIHTPTCDNLLDGITHDTILKLAAKRGYKVFKRDIYPSEMEHFDEFREIEGRKYTPGEVCHALAEDYDNLVRGKMSL